MATSTLRMTYGDVLTRIREYLGYASGAQDTLVADITKRAYRQMLFGINPLTGTVHKWSWLTSDTTLSIVTTGLTPWVVTLPDNFLRLNDKFQFADDTGYPAPTQVTASQIHALRSASTATGTPRFWAISGTYAEATGQAWSLMIYPTPDAAYTWHYSYYIDPAVPTTSAKYMAGTTETDEVVVEFGLAVCDEEENNRPKSGHRVLAKELMLAAIKQDRARSLPERMNMNRARSSVRGDVRSWIVQPEVTDPYEYD
jgi:hypothetical protein